MRDVQTDIAKPRRPIEADPAAGLAPIPPAAIAWRRRAIRLCWFMTIAGGLGLSAIPGPRAGSGTATFIQDGVQRVEVRKYEFSQPYGVPFVVARAGIDEAGNVKDFTLKGDAGLFGNFAVAFAISFGLLALWGRRRRED